MKAFYCLLALSLFGWASSHHAFQTGKSYRYQVRGRLMNGLTEISTQYAGLEMDYKLILTVTGPNTVNFKPIDIKFFEVNDVIKGGWKDGEFRNPTPVELTQEIRQWLESPMDVTFNKGIVESIKVQGDLPNWCINMKKAMASHFVVDTTGTNLIVEGNLNRETGHSLPEEKNLESGFHYETLEKTIHGECNTYYTVSQNGAFNEPMPFHQEHQPGVQIHEDSIHENTNDEQIVGEHPWHQTYNKFCQEKDQVYEIIKSVNFTSCRNKPVLSFMAPSMSLDARSGDNHFGGSMGLRTVVSRFLACGINREQFTILKIRQEEQVKVGLHATMKIMTGAIKNLTLIEILDTATPVQVNNPKVINTLVYQFAQQHREKAVEEILEMPQMDAAYITNSEDSVEDATHKRITDDEPTVLPKPTLTEAPVNSMLITPLKVEGLKKRIVSLVREIVQDILNKNHDVETIAEKETLSKISVVAKILRYLNYTDVQELYRLIAARQQTEEDKTARQVFFDCVAIAGTNPNIKLFFDLIQKREIVGDEVSRILMTLPMYIRTPTLELLKEYFILIQSEVLRGDKQARTTAVLSFSTVVYEACVNTRIRNARYPVALYGKFCDAQVVEQEFLPWFVKELERIIKTEDQAENTHWKLVYLTAIGNIGHPAVLPVLQRYLDNVRNPVVKTRVIFALRHLIIARSQQAKEVSQKLVADRDYHDVLTQKIVKEKVMPLLLAAAFDKGEHPDVRMAAVTLIFHSSEADKAIFQQLAYMTWFPASRQVHSLIYHSLKNMAAIERPIHPVHHRMQTIARQVLSLCKPVTLGYQSSRNLWNGDYITEFLTGYFSNFEYFGSKDSILPNMIYYRNFYQFGGEHGLGSNPIEFTFYGNTLQKLWNHLAKQFIEPSMADREAHEDLNKIHELLSIKDRKQQEKVEGYFYLKIRNEMERFITVNKEVIEQWTKNIMGDLLPKLNQGLPINFQKTLRLAEYTQEMPCIFGLPLNFKHRMPVHFSLRGNLKLATEENFKDFQIQAELEPVYAWKTHDKLSVKVPFLNKKYETGLQNHMVAQFPFRALIRKAPRNQITVAITPTHIREQTPNTELNIFTVHRVPYTAIIVDECFPVTHTEAGRVKIVRVLETPYKNERRFGARNLGLAFHFQEESDYTVEAEGQSQWIHFWTRFHTPSAWFHLGWLGAPSTKYVKRNLKLDMAQSQTKTFAVVLGGNWNMWWNKKNVNNMEIVETVKHTEEQVVEKHIWVAAFIGKKTPIRPLTSVTGIQKILVKGTPSTFHYLAHVEYKKGIHGRFNLRWVAGEACKEAVAKFPVEILSLAAIRDYIIESTAEVQRYKQCWELRSQWEVPTWASPRDLLVLRKRLLAQELVLNKNTEIHFGETCNQMPHQIKIKGAWKRGEKMTQWALTKSPEAKKCIEDERKGFEVSPVCLWVSKHQAAALNVADFEIEYTELPVWFKNVTYKFEDFLKATLYTYMQHNRYPENQLVSGNRMHFHFEMTPNKEFITFHFVKPSGHIEWRNVKTNVWAKKFLPFTATQTPVENIRDRTFQFNAQQTCTVEGKWVSTFDNVTFNFGEKVATGCTHLLTKDCTGKYPFAVLVKDIHTERKTVTVLLGGKNKITIAPLTAFMGLRKGNFKVMLNNQVITEFPKVIQHQQTQEHICTIELMLNGGVQIITRRVKVATDGARVVVYGHNDYKNRVCGICGNADYEKTAEMRSPKYCPLSNGDLLVASYSFDNLNAEESRGQCQIRPEIKARIEKENADCKRQDAHTFVMMSEINELTSSEEHKKFDSEHVFGTCNVIRGNIRKRLDQSSHRLCHTEREQNICPKGCKPGNTIQKEVMFKCPVNYERDTWVNKLMTIKVPTICVRA